VGGFDFKGSTAMALRPPIRTESGIGLGGRATGSSKTELGVLPLSNSRFRQVSRTMPLSATTQPPASGGWENRLDGQCPENGANCGYGLCQAGKPKPCI